MGIRASSGGQFSSSSSGSGGSGSTLTVEQVQDILSEALLPATTVEGLSLTSVYDDVTGKITLSLGTPPNSPITNVVPASIAVKRLGVAVGAAKTLNFAGSGLGAVTVADGVVTINVVGGDGSGSGVGISGAVINASGNLVIALTDGSVIDTGHVVGSNGAAGINGTNGISVTTATVNPAGQLIITMSTGQQINAGAVVGAQGPFGPQGAAGARGDTGLQGAAGVQGVQGTQGPAGRSVASNGATIDSNGNLKITLSDGTILNAGHAVGAQGAQGTAGPQGTQGLQGPAGATGATGATGTTGAQGIKGDTGTVGPQGSQGVAGPKGDTGATGATGAASTVAGPKGDTGTQGLQGVAGVAGVAGAKGDTGTAGATGTTGTSYSLNGVASNVQVYGLSSTTQPGYNLEVDLANKANKLTTARNITLSGKVTGLTSFDGSGNVTMITALSGVTTSDVAEGTNKYFTDAKARAALSASTGLSYNSTSGVMALNANSDQITEGSNNLYFTNNRFDNRLGQSSLAQFSDVVNTSPVTGQALVWNGSAWAPGTVSGGGGLTGAGAGVFKATAQIEYDTNGNLSSVNVLNGGISAVITTATSTTATVTFTFTGSTCTPLSIQVYGYQRTNNVYVTRALASDFPTRTIAAGGASGAPTTFNAFDSSTNTMTISLTKSVTGASAGIGQTTHCVLQFLLSSI